MTVCSNKWRRCHSLWHEEDAVVLRWRWCDQDVCDEINMRPLWCEFCDEDCNCLWSGKHSVANILHDHDANSDHLSVDVQCYGVSYRTLNDRHRCSSLLSYGCLEEQTKVCQEFCRFWHFLFSSQIKFLLNEKSINICSVVH